MGPATLPDAPPRVLLLGYGAIGRHVARLLTPDVEAGRLTLAAAVRDPAAYTDRLAHAPAAISELLAVAEALPASTDPDLGAGGSNGASGGTEVSPGMAPSRAASRWDLVVECAGVEAARQHGPALIGAGTDLVLTSVGALADPETARALLSGPGRLHVTNGAIGGLDALGAAADAGGLDTVRIRTAKLPGSLVRPWMDAAEAERLTALRPGEPPVTVFSGGPAAAIDRFPANVNVAVALAWATRGLGEPTGGAEGAGVVPQGPGDAPNTEAELLARSLERVRVELVADPAAERSRHEILAEGPAGRFELSFESAPSPENPKTSGMTALSVARTLRVALGLS